MWRYSIWILPLGILSAVMLYEWLKMKKFKKFKAIYQLSILVTLVYGIGIGLLYSKGYFEYLIDKDLKKYHKATYYWAEYDWINKNLPEDATFLVIVGAGQTYYLDREYIRGDSMSGEINWDFVKDVLSLKNILRSRGIDYIFYVRNQGKISCLFDELAVKSSARVVFDRKTPISTQRILGTYTIADVRLLELL